MTGYPIPAAETRVEIEVLRSRFIATLAPAPDVAAAKAFVRRIKAEFADASHNVPAYLVGYGDAVIAHCNDDGEPSGTAGRPLLAVLQGSGLGDVAVVVTRYFGGVKLGTGGLVRAYGDAGRAVLAETPRAEKVLQRTASVTLPYTYLERVRRLIAAHDGEILDEQFAAEVVLIVRLTAERLPAFTDELEHMSHGRLTAVATA